MRNMKNYKEIFIGTILAFAGLSLLGCNSKNNLETAYNRIDKISCSVEEKNNLKGFYSSIDLNNLSPEETQFLKLDDKEKRELLDPSILEWSFEKRLVDTTNITNLDYIALYRIEEARVIIYTMPKRNN